MTTSNILEEYNRHLEKENEICYKIQQGQEPRLRINKLTIYFQEYCRSGIFLPGMWVPEIRLQLYRGP
ncbi:MAG TPA: hypothetical protein VE445_04940 [Nitrososphaeraceae archaeon]|nr:hypothetical protein [Nitrososphaeraceae archaeon]